MTNEELQEDLLRMANEYAKSLEPKDKLTEEMIALDSLGFINKVLEKYCIIEKQNK